MASMISVRIAPSLPLYETENVIFPPPVNHHAILEDTEISCNPSALSFQAFLSSLSLPFAYLLQPMPVSISNTTERVRSWDIQLFKIFFRRFSQIRLCNEICHTGKEVYCAHHL
jgi:hypothetical protein